MHPPENPTTEVCDLERIAKKLRRHILTMAAGKGQGYVGQGLGMADIMAALYFHELKYDPKNLAWEDRDRFVLSTGHYSIALWAVLAEAGAIPLTELPRYGADESRLEMSTLDSTPGVEMTGGSLGHGLSQGVGMALAIKLLGKPCRVFVELSDGEMQEGSIWEAAMSAAHFALSNLVAIVDCNGIQADGPLVMDIEPVAEKWKSFGWKTAEIDGNDMTQIVQALHDARPDTGMPNAIIARTRPGNGVPAIENCDKAHFLNVSHINWQQAINELEQINE
jgi:transketolase